MQCGGRPNKPQKTSAFVGQFWQRRPELEILCLRLALLPGALQPHAPDGQEEAVGDAQEAGLAEGDVGACPSMSGEQVQEVREEDGEAFLDHAICDGIARCGPPAGRAEVLHFGRALPVPVHVMPKHLPAHRILWAR